MGSPGAHLQLALDLGAGTIRGCVMLVLVIRMVAVILHLHAPTAPCTGDL